MYVLYSKEKKHYLNADKHFFTASGYNGKVILVTIESLNPHFTITISICMNCKVCLVDTFIMALLHAPKLYVSYLDFDVKITRKMQAVYFVR